MKSLHKKISAVALIGIFAVPVLSQGFLANAISIELKNKSPRVLSVEEYQNLLKLVKYEDLYNYFFVPLDGPPEPKYLEFMSHKYRAYPSISQSQFKYKDIYEFEHALKEGKFDAYIKYFYRDSLDPVYINIGKFWYKFFFNLSPSQKEAMPIKEHFKKNGFDVVYLSRNDSVYDRAEFNSYIGGYRFGERKELLYKAQYQKQDLIQKLLKGPENKRIFSSIDLFKIDVSYVEEKPGYYIYRVDKHDFLVYKKSPN